MNKPYMKTQRLAAGHGIGNIVERLGNRGVIAGDSLDIAGLGRSQLAIESSGGEQGQVKGRAYATDIGA